MFIVAQYTVPKHEYAISSSWQAQTGSSNEIGRVHSIVPCMVTG